MSYNTKEQVFQSGNDAWKALFNAILSKDKNAKLSALMLMNRAMTEAEKLSEAGAILTSEERATSDRKGSPSLYDLKLT